MKVSMWRSDYPESTNPLKFFLFSTRPHWRPAVIAMLAVVVASTLLTMVAYVFKWIANAVTLLPDPAAFQTLYLAVAAYLALLFFGHLGFRISGFAGARWATGARATARYALTAYVTLHSRAYFSNRFAGSLATKVTHASNGMRQMTEQVLWQFLELFVSVIASFVIAYFVHPILAYIFLLWVVLAFVVNVYFAKKRIPLSSKAQRLETRLNGATVDLLSNITTMQEYARRLFEIDRLRTLTEQRRTAGLLNWYFGDRVLILNGILQAVFGGAMAFATVFYAAEGLVAFADIILILTIIFRIEGLLLSLGQHINSFAETWGEISESLEEILEPHEMPDKQPAMQLAVQEASIDLKNVKFAFGEHAVFDDLSLHIPAGQRVGLVGRSGAGKSTLMRLLLRHHDIEAGTVQISATDIASVTQESLRQTISIVPQEPLLFHRSIRDNIAYGKPNATDDEIIDAARRAQAHDFIDRLPQKYATLVGERGVKLSGGERQRVAIARAILKNAPVLLLDEATSALDSESEVQIQKALSALMEGKTVIAIAHRLSTLREMDRILVMDQGKIVQEGTHDELVAAGGIYAELWSHQAGGFLQDK